MAPCPWGVTRALCLFFFVPARNQRYRGAPRSVFHLKSARSTPGALPMKAPPTRNTPPRCRPQVPTPKTIPTWQTTEAQPRKAAFGPSAANGLHNTKKAVPTSRRLPPLYSPRARRKMMDPAQDNQGTFLSAIPADLSRTNVSLHRPSHLQTKENRNNFHSGPSKETHKGRRPSGTRRSTPPKPSAGWSQVHDPGRAGTQAAQQGQDKT